MCAHVCGRKDSGPPVNGSTLAHPNSRSKFFAHRFKIAAPGKRGSQIEQWNKIKAAVSDRLIALGGTITHHHAVGRFHRPWYDRQRPEGFATALRAAKKALDPRGILNAGVLIDP